MGGERSTSNPKFIKWNCLVSLSFKPHWVRRIIHKSSFENKLLINSLSIDELGNWCLTGWQGACALQAQQGGIHGNPASGNYPCTPLPPATVTLKRVQRKKYLPYPILTKTHESRGREGWEQESATIHRKLSYK